MKLLDRLVLNDLVPKLLMGIGLFSTLFFALGPLIAATRFLKVGISRLVVLEFMGWDFAGPLPIYVLTLISCSRDEAMCIFETSNRLRALFQNPS